MSETGPATRIAVAASADRIDSVLPQTQCTRCGYPACRGYAQAIAEGTAGIDRCPPGGAEGVARLAAVTGLPAVALDPAYGREGPRQLAVIDESWCIGCTLCLDACPTDAILGRNKRMHTVVAPHCTGCELCVPACPVDCIAMTPATGMATGWDAWSQSQADAALQRYRKHVARRDGGVPARGTLADAPAPGTRSPAPSTAPPLSATPTGATDTGAPMDAKRAVIEAALRRARALRG
ncbi:electron transport complex subunit RsxB [Xylophilus ampelinus]|uniref:Electron transport complex protein RnfB n=1 Tax=Xylophilus ampelinus TaxID=54067 RepID=A0A318SKU6_9BURK|nr:electron transport complex subunit RsxB [Xylophilus ampelinus]MCS4508939.1 electron transport complex subunit RsxB [Xylophilus ampelinus]PYE79505.1 electron transport complex protein RnfB [Xylophilus ampelinus]